MGSNFLSYKTRPNPRWPHLSLITSVETLISNKVISTGIRGWDLNDLWMDTIQPTIGLLTLLWLKVSDKLWLEEKKGIVSTGKIWSTWESICHPQCYFILRKDPSTLWQRSPSTQTVTFRFTKVISDKGLLQVYGTPTIGVTGHKPIFWGMEATCPNHNNWRGLSWNVGDDSTECCQAMFSLCIYPDEGVRVRRESLCWKYHCISCKMIPMISLVNT